MKRIQRKRVKGWRMPENAVYVGRGSKWGNPFKIMRIPEGWCIDLLGNNDVPLHLKEPLMKKVFATQEEVRDASINSYKKLVKHKGLSYYNELRGHDLACWCKPDESCHADVILKLLEDKEQ